MKTFLLILILFTGCISTSNRSGFWLKQSEDIIEYSEDVNPKIKKNRNKQNKKNKRILKYNAKQDKKYNRNYNTFDIH